MPITQTILDVAAADPQQLAIVGPEPGEHLTYAQLVDDSARMFAAVAGLHAGQANPPTPAPETQGIPITAVSLRSAFHTSRIMAGLAGFRAVSATLDPRWPLEHQVDVIGNAGIGVVISDSTELATALESAGWTGSIVTLARFRVLERAAAASAAAAKHDAQAAGAQPQTVTNPNGEAAAGTAVTAPTVRDGAEPYLMLFSSGTTSAPKAFIKTRAQYRENVAVSAAHLEPGPGVHTLAPGPVSYSLTLFAIIECLATGGAAHVADEFSPVDAGRRIAQYGIARVVAVPSVVYALAAAAVRDPDRFETLRALITGGANLSAKIREDVSAILPQAHLINYYGAAEIGFIGDSREGDGTLINIYEGIECQVRAPQPEPGAPQPEPGAVLPEPGAVLPEGELGTVWIKAAACSDGYVAATTDAQLKGPDGWASVNDQGRMLGGRLSLAGRAGDVVVTGGHKVALPEVERAFDTMPGLGAVCAISLPSDTLGAVIALVIEESRSQSRTGKSIWFPSKSELLAFAREHLAPQFVPRRWYRAIELPRTVGGKIQRSATADLVAHGDQLIERI